MGLSTAEKNRRKRERKRRDREEQRKQEENEKKPDEKNDEGEPEVEIEYIPEPTPEVEGFEALQRFHELSAIPATIENTQDVDVGARDALELDDGQPISKRKIRDAIRPSIESLKQRVQRPDLVEAHDISAADPEFLILLKAIPGTVPVPRHWGRKRKYLQGKRGFEKPPFQLPDFITRTGITEIRDTVAEDEANMSARQKNRARVAPKMGAIDVDYRTLHDAFFKHQTKPANLTKFGDMYYEGKEIEVNLRIKPGGPFSSKLREALGMTSETSPPPWLVNMQRYGPPPTLPNLKIPGLNAPLATPECIYGYHPGGWGKPPVDSYGRPLYGGNPFDAPGSGGDKETAQAIYVTSDGKTIKQAVWGALPVGEIEDADDEESSDDEMDESSSDEESEEGEEGEQKSASAVLSTNGAESMLPLPPTAIASTAPGDLRKQGGIETPLSSAPKQLYQVVEQNSVGVDRKKGAVFSSEIVYAVPGLQPSAAKAPEGAESVLAKGAPSVSDKRKRKDEDDEDDMEKNFKF